MKVHVWETSFLAASGFLMLGCLCALAFATFGMEMHLPGRAGEVDPATVRTTAPFDQPGVRQTGPNAYEVVMLGAIWSFQPNEIVVPAGAEVTFLGTSADVLHGFFIEGTRVNLMLMPGQISRTTYRFKEPGEHLLVCQEYCGLGHHTMSGRVKVVAP